MPVLRQLSTEVDTITLPKSGVLITIRRNATGADKSEALAATLALRHLGFDSGQVYMRYLRCVAASMIMDWDATDENGKAIPVSPQQLATIADEEDYGFLMEDVAGRVKIREDDPEKERPFVMSSTQSSPGTSSKTPKTSRRSTS